MPDLQEKSIELWREEAWSLHAKLRRAEGQNEKLKEALQIIADLNNSRDRFSAEIDAIILNALGEDK